jgi:hypothetical protein
MISVNQTLVINSITIEKFEGSNGVRYLGALESVLARPFQTFDG